MRQLVFAAVLIAACVLVVRADEHEDRFVASMRTAIQEREAQRKELELQLKDLQAGRVNRRLETREVVTEVRGRKRYMWNSPEAKEKAVAEVQAKIDRLGGPEAAVPSLPFASSLSVGMIGRLPEVSESVTYALEQGQAVAIPQHTIYQYRIRQVIDGSNALIEQKRIDSQLNVTGTELFWLIAPIDGAADGSPLKMAGAYRVTGTRQYETAVGSSKTVFVLEPFDANKLIQRAKQLVPQSR